MYVNAKFKYSLSKRYVNIFLRSQVTARREVSDRMAIQVFIFNICFEFSKLANHLLLGERPGYERVNGTTTHGYHGWVTISVFDPGTPSAHFLR